MKACRKSKLFFVPAILLFCSCSSISKVSFDTHKFADSGSMVLSFQLPERTLDMAQSNLNESHPKKFAPLIGYFPPNLSRMPAANEVWIEIEKKEQKMKVFQGSSVLHEAHVDGAETLAAGEYLIQSKQSMPRWYASDSYFTRRGLAVPSSVSQDRFLRGALGSNALFLSEAVAIHSSPVWSPEVGGIRMDKAMLAKVFELTPLGVAVSVR